MCATVLRSRSQADTSGGRVPLDRAASTCWSPPIAAATADGCARMDVDALCLCLNMFFFIIHQPPSPSPRPKPRRPAGAAGHTTLFKSFTSHLSVLARARASVHFRRKRKSSLAHTHNEHKCSRPSACREWVAVGGGVGIDVRCVITNANASAHEHVSE